MKNKIVLITGASSGIGLACAETFAKEGANLILCARRQDRLENIANALSKNYSIKVLPVILDVTDAKDVMQIFTQLSPDWHNIDVLINNAGLALGMDKLNEGNFDDWDRMIDTNIKGVLYLTRTILPEMIQRNQGHIINISSISAFHVYPGGAVYCATKHALQAIHETLRKELVGTKIRVTSINPGAVETEFSEVRFKGNQQRAKKVYENFTPLVAADVADSVLFCATRPPHVNIQEIIIMPQEQVIR